MLEMRGSNSNGWGEGAGVLVVGALGGLALGLLIATRKGASARSVGERARGASARLRRPERLQGPANRQQSFGALEDAVLDVFMADEVLGERPIDVGAVSAGIIELSGSVRTEQEADRAVAAARRVGGVHTVVNWMEVDVELRHQDQVRRRQQAEDAALAERQHSGMSIGMGVRRQGEETDPDRPDDSQHQRERALEEADRDQWQNEGYTKRPRMAARPEDPRPDHDPHFRDDELDNQDPHGKHGTVTLDQPPQDLHPEVRVGEGIKPGVELELERAGLDPDHLPPNEAD